VPYDLEFQPDQLFVFACRPDGAYDFSEDHWPTVEVR
jgi:hypothetical protein